MQQRITGNGLMRFGSLVAQTGQGLLIPFIALLKIQIHEAPMLTPKCVGVIRLTTPLPIYEVSCQAGAGPLGNLPGGMSLFSRVVLMLIHVKR